MNTAAAEAAFRQTTGRVALSVLALTLAGLWVLMHKAGLAVDPLARSNAPYYLIGLIALILRFGVTRTNLRHARVIGDCAEYFAVFTAMALMGAVSAYPVCALTSGYHDAALQRIDLALGFDWLAWYRAVAASPLLQHLGIAAYRSIYLTPAVLFAWFAATGARDGAYRFMATFWLAAIITLGVFSLMPAVGPFSYLWHHPIVYMPESELWQPDLIPVLRAHQVHLVDLGLLRGLVSAPSFHACAATLYIATAWSIPRLRWPLLCVNAAMLLSTPVEGTHYLIDMILGAAVAIVAVVVVNRAVTVATASRTR